MRPLILAVLAACGEEAADPTAVDRTAAEFTPPAGLMLEYVPPGQGSGDVRWIHAAADTWEVRDGADWDTAAAVATWSVALDGGLRVEDSLVLPSGFREGDSFDNGRVVALGERAVWYGTFPDVVTVELTGGPLEGTVALAAGVGPIAIGEGGWGWELASYAAE